MMTSETGAPLYVWIYLPGQGTPVVAGRLNPGGNGLPGRFVYGRSYLERPDALPLDPVGLPLRRGECRLTALNGIPGVVLDAGPDRWGISVLDRLFGPQAYPLGYLRLNDPGRSGCLAFSDDPAQPPVELASLSFSLEQLQAAAAAVEADATVDTELLKALHPGTGGARPKCSLVIDDAVWIAKFTSRHDPRLCIPRLEHATLTLARACGIDTADSRLVETGDSAICLVRRFDRDYQAATGTWTRRGFLSASTVFYDDPGFAQLGTGSYLRLARWLPRFGGDAAQRQALFRRMVFNCLIRNDDDHELNHGLLHQAGDAYALAPAYDLVPNLHPRPIHRHALLLGDSAAGTVANLVAGADAFALDRATALDLIHAMQAQVAALWPKVFYEAGFGDESLHRLREVFRPLPLSE